jgi:hypothetical protein
LRDLQCPTRVLHFVTENGDRYTFNTINIFEWKTCWLKQEVQRMNSELVESELRLHYQAKEMLDDVLVCNYVAGCRHKASSTFVCKTSRMWCILPDFTSEQAVEDLEVYMRTTPKENFIVMVGVMERKGLSFVIEGLHAHSTCHELIGWISPERMAGNGVYGREGWPVEH